MKSKDENKKIFDNVNDTNKAIDIARDLIYGDRHNQYGAAKDEFITVANICFELGLSIKDAQNVPIFMVILKLVRELHRHKQDNIVDAIGYLQLYDDYFQEVD